MLVRREIKNKGGPPKFGPKGGRVSPKFSPFSPKFHLFKPRSTELSLGQCPIFPWRGAQNESSFLSWNVFKNEPFPVLGALKMGFFSGYKKMTGSFIPIWSRWGETFGIILGWLRNPLAWHSFFFGSQFFCHVTPRMREMKRRELYFPN